MRAFFLISAIMAAACGGGVAPPQPELQDGPGVFGDLIPDQALVSSVGVEQTPTPLDESPNGVAGSVVDAVTDQPAAVSGAATSGTQDTPSSGEPAPNEQGPGQLGGIGDWTASVLLDPGSDAAEVGGIWLHAPYESITVDSNPFPFAASSVVTAKGLAADWEDTASNTKFCTPYIPTAAFTYSRVGAGDFALPTDGITRLPGIEYKSMIYFTGLVSLDSGMGTKLVRYDSAAPELRVVTNIRGAGDDLPGAGIVFNGNLYLPLTDAFNDGALKLWRFGDDGLEEVIEVSGSGPLNEEPDELTIVAGELCFTGKRSASERFIYRFSDAGTSPAVNRITNDNFDDPGNLVEMGGRLFFQAIGPSTVRKVWAWVPTSNEIFLVSNTFENDNDDPRDLTVYRGKLYFTAESDTGSRELYVYDPEVGQSGEVRMLLDLFPSPGDDNPEGLTVSDGMLYFSATVANTGSPVRKLFQYDGVANRFRQISNTNGDNTDAPDQLTPFVDGVLFTGPDVNGNTQLFHFAALANVVRTVTSHVDNVNYRVPQIVPWGDYAAFVAGDASLNILKLYLYDGVGISQMADIAGAGISDNITIIGPYQDSLAFSGAPDGNNESLYLLTPKIVSDD